MKYPQLQFIQMTKAYYYNACGGPDYFKRYDDNAYEEFTVGLYDEDGGSHGEVNFVWYNLGPGHEQSVKLGSFNDTWDFLTQTPELLRVMDQLADEKNITPELFIRVLEGDNGFVNATKTERPQS